MCRYPGCTWGQGGGGRPFTSWSPRLARRRGPRGPRGRRRAERRRGEARPAASRPKQTPCVQADGRRSAAGPVSERQGGPSATGPLRRASPPLALALSARVPEAVGSEPAWRGASVSSGARPRSSLQSCGMAARPPPGPAEQDASSGAGPGRRAAVVVSSPSFGTHPWARESISSCRGGMSPLAVSQGQRKQVPRGAGGVRHGSAWQVAAPGRAGLVDSQSSSPVGAGAAAAAGDSHRAPTEPSSRSRGSGAVVISIFEVGKPEPGGRITCPGSCSWSEAESGFGPGVGAQAGWPAPLSAQLASRLCASLASMGPGGRAGGGEGHFPVPRCQDSGQDPRCLGTQQVLSLRRRCVLRL